MCIAKRLLLYTFQLSCIAKRHFFMHETSDMYNKTQISLHDNGDLL